MNGNSTMLKCIGKDIRCNCTNGNQNPTIMKTELRMIQIFTNGPLPYFSFVYLIYRMYRKDNIKVKMLTWLETAPVSGCW